MIEFWQRCHGEFIIGALGFVGVLFVRFLFK
jgi:hypothetical protein